MEGHCHLSSMQTSGAGTKPDILGIHSVFPQHCQAQHKLHHQDRPHTGHRYDNSPGIKLPITTITTKVMTSGSGAHAKIIIAVPQIATGCGKQGGDTGGTKGEPHAH